MQANIFACIPHDHNTGSDEPNSHQADFPVHPSAFARNWLDARDHRRRDIPSDGIGWQDRYQFYEEVRKGLIFEVIPISCSCPFMGRSPLSFVEIFEGASCPSINYLAFFPPFLHHFI